MKQKIVVTIAVYLVVFCMSLTAGERSYPYNAFTEIDFGTPGKLVLSQSNEYSILIEGSEEQIQDIVIRENGKVLEIVESWTLFGIDPPSFDGVVIRVTIPRLEAVTVSSLGSVQGRSLFNASEHIRLATKSSGDLSLSVQTAEIEAVTLSNGSIDLQGKTDTLTLKTRSSGNIFFAGDIRNKLSAETRSMGQIKCDLNPHIKVPESHLHIGSMGSITILGNGRYIEAGSSSAGDLQLKDFPCEHLKLDLTSSGNAFINVTGALNMKTSGSGRVINYGTPRIK